MQKQASHKAYLYSMDIHAFNSAAEHHDQVFDGLALNTHPIRPAEFHDCVFKKCNLSDASLAGKIFVDCIFEDCNLSMAKLPAVTLNDVRFKSCKILGVIFSECQDRLFSVQFTGCVLDYTSFYGKKMIKTRFDNCSLKESNFSGSNVSQSTFKDCDLLGASFRETNLEKADLSSAYNYIIDPELNNLKKAIFSINGVAGLLSRHDLKLV